MLKRFLTVAAAMTAHVFVGSQISPAMAKTVYEPDGYETEFDLFYLSEKDFVQKCYHFDGRIDVQTMDNVKQLVCETAYRDKLCNEEKEKKVEKGALAGGGEFNIYTEECGGCFVTTACVEHMGLADDCWELNALRKFRDTYLSSFSEGRRDVKLYERTAPSIVSRIKSGASRDRDLAALYAFYILPSAIGGKLGLNKWVHKHYKSMMKRLLVSSMREFDTA